MAVSHTSFHEDLLLLRAFQHVSRGFYIHVGAGDPEGDSVTRLFHEKKWRGIHVDPTGRWVEKLKKHRPGDMCLALSLHAHGPSPFSTLHALCGKHHAAPIHFLKIEEAANPAAVLEHLDLERYRPWVVVVPSLPSLEKPPAGESSFRDKGDEKLLHHRYHHAHHDGLNHFYVAREHPELLPAFDLFFRFTGHVEGHYSLAVVNRGLSLALEDLLPGRVSFKPHSGVPLTPDQAFAQGADPAMAPLFARETPPGGRERVISVVHHYPLMADPHEARQRWALFFWEETAVPREAIGHLHNHLDGVLVASRFVRNALRNSGCRLPVRILPLGVDPFIEPPGASLPPLRPLPGKPFRFLHLSSLFDRKGPDLLLRAYLESFSSRDNVELCIKTFPNPHNRIHELWDTMRREREDPPPVHIHERPLSHEELVALYRSAQGLVLPTRGEGFNLPAAEAMALGVPVVVTAHGGHRDFCTGRTALCVPFSFALSRSHLKGDGSCWMEPGVKELGEAMKTLRREVLTEDPVLHQRRQRAMDHVRRVYTWGESSRALLRASGWLDALPPPKERFPRTLALVSPWATPCGVAQYAGKLLSTFDPSRWKLRVYCDTRTERDEGQDVFEPLWEAGRPETVLQALDRVEREGHEAVLVQFQPSLFNMAHDILLRLARLRHRGAVVILELHVTRMLLDPPFRPSAPGIGALKSLDRIVVHNVEDLNNLLSLGVVENVMLLPLMGVEPLESPSPATRRNLGAAPGEKLLATFGFLLDHKGVDTLIRSLQPLKEATGETFRLLSLNAVVDGRGRETLENLQRLARRLGVEDRVIWRNQYHDARSCQEFLSAAHFILFPYRYTQESASAAVTMGMAALKPVLVSPLPIFQDVAGSCFSMEGCEVDHVVSAVLHLLRHPGEREELVRRQRGWVERRRPANISRRLENTFLGLFHDREVEKSVSSPFTHRVSFGENPLAVRELEGPSPETAQLFVDISPLFCPQEDMASRRAVRGILWELLSSPPSGLSVMPVYRAPGEDVLRYSSRFWQEGHPLKGQKGGQEILCGEGDVFLGTESSLRGNALPFLKASGVSVHLVVQNSDPSCHSIDMEVEGACKFLLSQEKLRECAGTLLCFSAAHARRLRLFLKGHEPPPVPPALDSNPLNQGESPSTHGESPSTQGESPPTHGEGPPTHGEGPPTSFPRRRESSLDSQAVRVISTSTSFPRRRESSLLRTIGSKAPSPASPGEGERRFPPFRHTQSHEPSPGSSGPCQLPYTSFPRRRESSLSNTFQPAACTDATEKDHAQSHESAASRPVPPAIVLCPPGSDLDHSLSPSLPPDIFSFLDALGTCPSFLLVGTVDSGGGHGQVLGAFEEFWARNVPIRLVLAGKEGRQGNPLAQKLRQHREKDRNLFWLEEVSDRCLKLLLTACTCLLLPAFRESSPLPVLEAARHRLPILARDLPLHREAAGEHAHYFSGESPEALHGAIVRWLSLHRRGLHPSSSPIATRTWKEWGNQLKAIMGSK